MVRATRRREAFDHARRPGRSGKILLNFDEVLAS
jgi:hypothetical protein